MDNKQNELIKYRFELAVEALETAKEMFDKEVSINTQEVDN